MAKDKTLHVKIDEETSELLGELARARKTTKGTLVREALVACYQLRLDELPVRHRRALEAYRGGYISIGKLAEVMGVHVLDLRAWLAEHGVQHNTETSPNDVDLA